MTGRTVNTSIVDLGDVTVYPSHVAAMRGYIALSRARTGQHLLLSHTINLALIKQQSQPFPTMLMEVMRGNVAASELAAFLAAFSAAQLANHMAIRKASTEATATRNSADVHAGHQLH